MKKDQCKEKVRHKKNRREESRGRKKIILKKVIISAKGFAVAQTTNKAVPVGRCATEKAEKRRERLWRVREQMLSITVLISRIISENQLIFCQ